MKIKDLNWLEEIFTNLNLKHLPHGTIISGPEGLGKKILAKEIAIKLLLNKNSHKENIDLIEADNHPDLFLIDKEKILLHNITFRKNKWDEDKGKRNVNDFLSITPSIAINKVAIIFNAQTMNDESQNALLKSLEEPAPNTYIIMTTNRPKSLLQTIYSRCQVISIPSLSTNQLNEWLINKGIANINSTNFPSFSTPLSILSDIENDKHMNFNDFINIISDFIENKSDINNSIKDISNLDIKLIVKINYLIEFLKIILKSKLVSENLSGIYLKYNSSNFNNLKVSNLLNDLNNLRHDYFKVPQINETHILNYFLSEIKNSIKI
tara:strand:+ start:591 stop:1559 length:969 start_codon:yes stop_codon:yes gene_type:complete